MLHSAPWSESDGPPLFAFQPLQAAELIDSEFRPGMSSRQKNKAKRMAKLVAKQRSRDVDPNEKRSDYTLHCNKWTMDLQQVAVLPVALTKEPRLLFLHIEPHVFLSIIKPQSGFDSFHVSLCKRSVNDCNEKRIL